MTAIFTYHEPDRTVRAGFSPEQALDVEQAQVVALVKIGDALTSLNKKLDHIIMHGLNTGR